MNNNSDLAKYNDELSEIYDEVTKQPKYGWNTPNKVFEYVKDYLTKHSKALDLGVGTGQSIEFVSEITTNLVGVDISQEMIKKAKKKVPKADFYNFNLNSKFVSDKDFDLVIASGVLEFVKNIDFLFKNVSNSLKKEGLFCFTFEIKQSNSNDEPLPSIKYNKKLSFKMFRRSEDSIEKLLLKYSFKEIKSELFTGYFKYIKDEKIAIPYKIILAKKV